MYAYAEHNGLFIQYSAADEAQSLAAIFRGEEGAIDGVSIFPHLWRGVPARAFRLT